MAPKASARPSAIAGRLGLSGSGAGGRQSVETVEEKLAPTFRLDRERPQELSGFQSRLAAKSAWREARGSNVQSGPSKA